MKGLELKFGVSRSGLSVLRVSGKLPSSCLGFRSGPYCKELYFSCRNFCCALAVEKFTAEGQTADQWSSEVCRYVCMHACTYTMQILHTYICIYTCEYAYVYTREARFSCGLFPLHFDGARLGAGTPTRKKLRERCTGFRIGV